jgi:hypothetical protein
MTFQEFRKVIGREQKTLEEHVLDAEALAERNIGNRLVDAV